MQQVYVLVHSYSNDDCDGFIVEGVYTTKKAAQIAMKLLADTAKSEFGYPFDDDFTIETDTVIGFGSDNRDFFSVPNTECFEIFTRELLDGGD